jgi:Asp/Glu/hydantoin racemase
MKAPSPRLLKLLVVNSNSNPTVTERVARVIEAAVPECTVTALTAAYGPRGIGGRSDLVVSAMATLEALAEHADGHDAAIIACYSDPGLAAARELLRIPVVGIGEASFVAGAQLGAYFGIVTVGPRVRPIINEAVHAFGLDSRFTGVEIVDDASLSAEDPLPLLEEGVARAAKAGAEVAILGGAAFAGMARALGERCTIPVVGSVEASAGQAVALARLGVHKAKRGSYSMPARKAMKGLPRALAEKLALEGLT